MYLGMLVGVRGQPTGVTSLCFYVVLGDRTLGVRLSSKRTDPSHRILKGLLVFVPLQSHNNHQKQPKSNMEALPGHLWVTGKGTVSNGERSLEVWGQCYPPTAYKLE